MKNLSIIVPCFNEEEILPQTAAALKALLSEAVQREAAGPDSRIVLVDDGSTDKSWEIIAGLSQSDRVFKGIKLSRNFGHQNALLAGLMQAPGDLLVTLDADLQDSPPAILEMLEKNRGGAEIVYGVRRGRKTDSAGKRFSARLFYKLLQGMGVETVYDHADFRLLSRRALEELSRFSEVNLFLRGMIPLLGFKTALVTYDRRERAAGKSKYSFSRMFTLALEGITSFSVTPLRIISLLGFFLFLASLALGVWILMAKFHHETEKGWASMTLLISFLSGVQLLSLGVLGEYLGKTYRETKRRPRYIIEEETD